MKASTRASARVEFEDFVAARGLALQHAAWLLTSDVQLGQDLVQTALADAWRRWGKLSDPGNDAEAYVRRAMYSTYVSWWRRRSFRERPADLAAAYNESDSSQGSRADAACEVVDRVTVSAALKQLSAQQRAVLILRFFDDCTIEQTANFLGMSTSATTTHQARALARLRKSGLLADEEILHD